MINDLLIVLDDIFSSKSINNQLKMKIIRKILIRDCNIILKTKYIKEYIIKNMNDDLFEQIFWFELCNYKIIIELINMNKITINQIIFLCENLGYDCDGFFEINGFLAIKALINKGYKDHIKFNGILVNCVKSIDNINNYKFLIKNSNYIDNEFYAYILDYKYKKFLIWLNDNYDKLNIIESKIDYNSGWYYNINYKTYKLLINLNIKWKYVVYNWDYRDVNIHDAKLIKYLIQKEDLNFATKFKLNKYAYKKKSIYNNLLLLYMTRTSKYVLNFII